MDKAVAQAPVLYRSQELHTRRFDNGLEVPAVTPLA